MVSRLFEKYRSNQNSIEGYGIRCFKLAWTVAVTRDLPANVFGFIMEMLKKARSSYVVTHSESRYSDCIVYTESKRIDLSEICLDFATFPEFKGMERSQERRSEGYCNSFKTIYPI